MKKTCWFSIQKFTDCSFHIGIGVGWGKDDHIPALMLEFGMWWIVIGPHYAAIVED